MSDAAPPPAERLAYAGLAALLAVLWFATLGGRPLFGPDEGRYAEIPREMLSGGDWVIPHLNGVAYIEKPPLQYWATALSLRVFGHDEFAARFYTAACAVATLLMVASVARRLWGAKVAWRAAAMLGSMLLFVVLGQLLTLDMSLTLYMTAGLCGFLLAQPPPQPRAGARAVAGDGRGGAMAGARAGVTADERARGGSGAVAREGSRAAMLLAWAAIALGVLTKGLVAAAIPAAVLVLYSLIGGDFSPWRRLDAGRGLPLFLVLTVPWHWLAARRMPGFLEFFFVHEHLARYLTPSADREEPWWYFGAVFLFGSLPWTLTALRTMGSGWGAAVAGWREVAAGRRGAVAGRRGGVADRGTVVADRGTAVPVRGTVPADAGRSGGGFRPELFLRIWVAFVIVFFSLSDSKLIPYVLPALPALALLMAVSAPAALRREVTLVALLSVLTAVGLGLVCWQAPQLLAGNERRVYFLALVRPLAEIAVLLGVSGLFVLTRRRRGSTQGTLFLGAGWCLAGMLLMRAAAAVAPIYSGATLAAAGLGVVGAAPVFSVATYDQTLPFYWQRTVTLVAYRGELDFGLQRDPGAELADVDAFLRRWRDLPQAHAVMEGPLFDELRARGVPMREIARDVHRVLVARR